MSTNEEDISRLYSKMEGLEHELHDIIASISTLKEQARKTEHEDAHQNTEIGNLRQSLGKYSSTIEYLQEQIKTLADQRDQLASSNLTASETVHKMTSFQILFEEKLKNMLDFIERVKGDSNSSVKSVKAEIEVLNGKITGLSTKLNYAYGVLLTSMFSFICWVIKLFGSAKGWW